MTDSNELCGIICINKPKGFTSFDVVAKLRGILKMKRLGHAGTLDPMAEGVLPVFIGRATMACDMLPDRDKSYSARFRLGITTDTQDITGNITHEAENVTVTRGDIEAVLGDFRGNIMQLPPMYSAVSVNGKRLYELARKNIEVEREPREITVYSLNLTDYDSESHEGGLEISCSKGTYIRTLINDIGDRLGCGGAMTALTRTAACGFTLADCTDFAALERERENGGDLSVFIRPIETVFSDLPRLLLTPSEEKLYRQGSRMPMSRFCMSGISVNDNIAVYGGGRFIGTARAGEDEKTRTAQLCVGKTFFLRNNEDIGCCKNGYAVALGLFDGVHKGHRAVIGAAKRSAEENGRKLGVFTFDTRTVKSKGLDRGCILTETEKERRLYAMGADHVIAPDFSGMKDMSAEEFVSVILFGRMEARTIVCGEDFRFGRNAEGDVDMLSELVQKYGRKDHNDGAELIVVPAVADGSGEKISSGRIRELIAEGKTDEASRLMDGGFVIDMPVIGGRHLGRTIGFPTINQHFPAELIRPRFGVYASYIETDGRRYRGITNVGVKPTVTDSGELLCETNIFDFDGDIYGRNVRVTLDRFVRGEMRFQSVSELKARIAEDTAYVRTLDI